MSVKQSTNQFNELFQAVSSQLHPCQHKIEPLKEVDQSSSVIQSNPSHPPTGSIRHFSAPSSLVIHPDRNALLRRGACLPLGQRRLDPSPLLSSFARIFASAGRMACSERYRTAFLLNQFLPFLLYLLCCPCKRRLRPMHCSSVQHVYAYTRTRSTSNGTGHCVAADWLNSLSSVGLHASGLYASAMWDCTTTQDTAIAWPPIRIVCTLHCIALHGMSSLGSGWPACGKCRVCRRWLAAVFAGPTPPFGSNSLIIVTFDDELLLDDCTGVCWSIGVQVVRVDVIDSLCRR